MKKAILIHGVKNLFHNHLINYILHFHMYNAIRNKFNFLSNAVKLKNCHLKNSTL